MSDSKELSCLDVLNDLSNFVDGGLGDDKIGAVRAHLTTCNRCARFGVEFKDLLDKVRHDLGIPEPLERAVAQRLRDVLDRSSE